MDIDNAAVHPQEAMVAGKPIPVMLLLVCVYMFLVIERPWESIRYLDGLPVERIYAVFMLFVALLQQKLKVVSSPTNKWVYGLLFLHFALAPFAYNAGDAFAQGIEYAKMVVLYVLMLSVIEDEESLKFVVLAYIVSLLLYASHSLLEYHNGRHFYRMGITRMIGVDRTFNDPNAFGASLVISLPIAYIVARFEKRVWLRRAAYCYFPLVLLCVVLTGSRSAYLGIVFLAFLWVLALKGKQRLAVLVLALLSLGLVWNVMSVEKQSRLRTLWNDESGPANAYESASGRKEGMKASWEMFKKEPLTGVGAGGKNFIGYRLAQIDKSPIQAHVLYGEVIAELGLFGALCFAGLVASTWRCCRQTRRNLQFSNGSPFLTAMAGGVIFSLLMLLFLGMAGHNFYRPLWLWLAAWSGILLRLSGPAAPPSYAAPEELGL